MITNKIKDKNWKNKLNKFKLDPTLNWKTAEITSLNDLEAKFKIINDKKNNSEEFLSAVNLKWIIPKKKFITDVFKIGDIIFVKKENNYWDVKQYPVVNEELLY